MEEDFKKAWLAAWECPSPHRDGESVYGALVRAAEKAFAKVSADGYHWPNFDIARPTKSVQVLKAAQTTDEARESLKLAHRSLNSFAIALFCDSVWLAKKNLIDINTNIPKGSDIYFKKRSKEDLDTAYKNFCKRVERKLSEVMYASFENAANMLSLKGSIKIIRGNASSSQTILPPKLAKAQDNGQSIFNAMEKVRALTHILNGHPLLAIISMETREEDGTPRSQPEQPTRGSIIDLAQNIKQHISNFCSLSLNEYREPLPSNIKQRRAQILVGAAIEGSPDESAAAARAHLIADLQRLVDWLHNLYGNDELFVTVTSEGRIDDAAHLAVLKAAFEDKASCEHDALPFLPSLIADITSRVDAGSFDELLQTTLAIYCSPRKLKSALASDKEKSISSALQRYSMLYHRLSSCNDFPYSQLCAPIERHFATRLWVLTTLFRSALETSNPPDRDCHLSLVKALLGVVVCEQEDSLKLRYDYVEAIPHWADSLHNRQGRAASAFLHGQTRRLLVDAAYELGLNLHSLQRVENVRPTGVCKLNSEGGIHKAYKKSNNSSYPANRVAKYLSLETVDTSSVKFKLTGKRSLIRRGR
jgi:hypothetical protein